MIDRIKGVEIANTIVLWAEKIMLTGGFKVTIVNFMYIL